MTPARFAGLLGPKAHSGRCHVTWSLRGSPCRLRGRPSRSGWCAPPAGFAGPSLCLRRWVLVPPSEARAMTARSSESAQAVPLSGCVSMAWALAPWPSFGRLASIRRDLAPGLSRLGAFRRAGETVWGPRPVASEASDLARSPSGPLVRAGQVGAQRRPSRGVLCSPSSQHPLPAPQTAQEPPWAPRELQPCR